MRSEYTIIFVNFFFCLFDFAVMIVGSSY